MTVVEVGPVTVRGPGAVSAASRVAATTAVDCIDDPIALIDDRLVAVEELWATVIADAAGPDAETLTLVCPTWWTVDQMARIRVAAAAWDSVVLHRVQALTAGLRKVRWAVVEIATEVVMVSRADADPVTVVRGDDAVVDAVLTAVGPADHVVIDAPAEVIGAHEFGRAVSDRVRRRGGHVSPADLTALHHMLDHDENPTGTIKDRGRTKLWLGAALLAASLCAGLALASGNRPVAGGEMGILVEGRVGMQVPVDWTVQRITGGPGSARVQVVSPADPNAVIHLTQSGIPEGGVADSLRRALDEESAGVFVGFNPADRVGDRPVISYREMRAERHIRWAVLVDGTVRIAIGCQSRPGRDDLIRQACDAAIRSAHAVR